MDTSEDKASKLPFGMRHPDEDVAIARREAAKELLRAVEAGTSRTRYIALAIASKRMRDMFGDVASQLTEDWFVCSGLLAHPSQRLAERTAHNLKTLNWAVNDGDGDKIAEILKMLYKKRISQMLDHYLLATRKENPIPVVDDAQWIMFIYSSKDPATFYLEASSEPVLEVIADMDERNPDLAPYRAASAWRVMNLDSALDCLERHLAAAAAGDGFYTCGDKLGLYQMIKSSGELLLQGNGMLYEPMWKPETITAYEGEEFKFGDGEPVVGISLAM